MKRFLLLSLLGGLLPPVVEGAFIPYSVTATHPGYVGYGLAHINDGVVTGVPMGPNPQVNGYIAPGPQQKIEFEFVSGPQTIESFTLWNEVKFDSEGVESFELEFRDSGGGWIGTTPVLTANVGQVTGQSYTFTPIPNAQYATMTIHGVHNQFVEIREAQFCDVDICAVPEPGGLAFGGLALMGMLFRRKKRRPLELQPAC